MASSALQKQVYEKLKNLSDIQLRENEDFIAYVNKRTKLALKARKEGKKFHRKPNTLEELQRE